MCANGQSSDPLQASFNVNGIGLVPGRIEIITSASSAPGQRHAELFNAIGKVALWAWHGPTFVRSCPFCSLSDTKVGPAVKWILGENWFPYQRATFVTPPFGGYTSGHSAFSRAAAHVLTLLTGSRFFPGGLGTFEAKQDKYLVFEFGPQANVTLQWASYFVSALAPRRYAAAG